MDGLFIFDPQNDIIFTNLNEAINKKLFELAKKQELLPGDAVFTLYFYKIPHIFTFKLCFALGIGGKYSSRFKCYCAAV